MKIFDLKRKTNPKCLAKKYKCLDFVDKMYVASYTSFFTGLLLGLFLLVIGKNVEIIENIFISMILLSIPLFSLSLIHDIIDSSENILKHTSTKLAYSIAVPLLSLYCLIEVYQNINAVFGVDPSLLGFTVSILFIWNIVSKIIAALLIFLFFFVLALNVILPMLNMINTRKWKMPFRWKSRICGIFSLYVLSVVVLNLSLFKVEAHSFLDKMMLGIKMPAINSYSTEALIQKIGIYTDFNKGHHCTNPELENRPVLFLNDRFVLVPGNENYEFDGSFFSQPYYKNFQTKKCLLES